MVDARYERIGFPLSGSRDLRGLDKLLNRRFHTISPLHTKQHHSYIPNIPKIYFETLIAESFALIDKDDTSQQRQQSFTASTSGFIIRILSSLLVVIANPSTKQSKYIPTAWKPSSIPQGQPLSAVSSTTWIQNPLSPPTSAVNDKKRL